MKYDLKNPLDKQNLLLRVKKELENANNVVEFSVCKPKRTIKQNRYLHVILSYFACSIGLSADYVKQNYFKLLCNKEIFVIDAEDVFIGKTRRIRSSSELTTEEMSIAIERFRNWSAETAGIYIPSAEEYHLLQLAEIQVERNKLYL